MDANQLQQLALNAELNHWPPHLGVTTDAEKIEYLAARLRECADAEARATELAEQVVTLEEANDMLQTLIDDMEIKLGEIRDMTL